GGFGGFARGALLLFAHAARFGELFFLLANGFGFRARFFLAALQLELFGGPAFRLLDRPRGGVAPGRDALPVHLCLDRACLAAGVGLLDLRRRLARQRDLLALGRGRGAVRRAQELEQALLVVLGQRVVGRLLADAGRLQLLEQRRRRAVELRGELGDG